MRRLRSFAGVLALALVLGVPLAACESDPAPGGGSSGVTDTSITLEQLRAKGCC